MEDFSDDVKMSKFSHQKMPIRKKKTSEKKSEAISRNVDNIWHEKFPGSNFRIFSFSDLLIDRSICLVSSSKEHYLLKFSTNLSLSKLPKLKLS